jgi:DNA-binding transcriptional LysR family regulator
VASYWLPGRLARFATLYPGISVRLIVANTAQASQMVMDGLVDFSVVEGKVLDPKLLRTDIGSDRLSIYASPQHELGAAQRASVQDLKDAQWIMREAGSGTKSELELALGVHGINMDDLVVLMELPSNEAVLGAVSSGGVIAAVSDLAAAPHVAAGNLVPVGFSLTMRRFTLLSHSERLLSHAARALAETFAP